jgi:hypothetical protein
MEGILPSAPTDSTPIRPHHSLIIANGIPHSKKAHWPWGVQRINFTWRGATSQAPPPGSATKFRTQVWTQTAKHSVDERCTS